MPSKGSWRAGFETVSDFRMAYRDWRPAGGEGFPPVVALHGSLLQSGMWLATAEGVAKARFVCPDQRGFGKSADPGAGESAADFARDAINLSHALHLDRFTVMGHSFAAAIALSAAILDPGRVAAVVLMDPTVQDAKRRRDVLASSRERPAQWASRAEAARYFREKEPGRWPAARLRRFIADVMVGDEGEGAPCRTPYTRERLLRLREFQASAATDYKPVELTRKVKCPVLVFRGEKSDRFSEEGERRLMAALPKGARLVRCPNSGHFPTVSDGPQVEKALAAFLAKVK